MKKYLTLPNILACLGFVFGIVGFCMMFTDQLCYTISSFGESAKAYIPFSDTFFDQDGSIIGFIGFLLIGVGALANCFVACPHFVKNLNTRKIITACLSLLILAGAILVFIQAAVINGKGNSGTLSIGGIALLHADFSLAIGPILGGVFAIASSLSYCVGVFCADK